MPKLPVNQPICFQQQARSWQEEVQNISVFVKLLSHLDIYGAYECYRLFWCDVWKRSEDWKRAFVEVGCG